MKKFCFYCPEDIFQPGGGSTVAENVLKNFQNHYKNTVIFSKNTIIPNEISTKYIIRRIRYPKIPIIRVLFDLFIAPFILLKYKNDKVICLNSIIPLLYPFHIEVFFQMRMFYFEEFDTLSKKVKNILGKLSLKKAKKIFVASEDHKNDLVKNLSLNPEKIKVTYLGFDFKYNKEDLSKCHLSLHNEYWLFISIFRPYKNIDGLINAYAHLNLKYKNIPELILIGDYPSNYEGIDNYKEKVASLIDKYNLKEKIKFIGLKSHKETMRYLANSSLFIFPSKFEGFGLPILEAMALSVPILSSNSHSLPEIGGDTIMYFNPNVEDDLYDKLELIYTEGYKKNTTNAEKRSRTFTWDKTCDIIANE